MLKIISAVVCIESPVKDDQMEWQGVVAGVQQVQTLILPPCISNLYSATAVLHPILERQFDPQGISINEAPVHYAITTDLRDNSLVLSLIFLDNSSF